MCDQCNAIMINKVYCHETGCPNTGQPYQKPNQLSEEFINVSLSQATLKEDDLIPAFYSFLEDNFPNIAKEIKEDEDYYYCLEFGHFETETSAWLLERLFDELDEVSSEKCYFGSHEGDGSDFGFWRI